MSFATWCGVNNPCTKWSDSDLPEDGWQCSVEVDRRWLLEYWRRSGQCDLSSESEHTHRTHEECRVHCRWHQLRFRTQEMLLCRLVSYNKLHPHIRQGFNSYQRGCQCSKCCLLPRITCYKWLLLYCMGWPVIKFEHVLCIYNLEQDQNIVHLSVWHGLLGKVSQRQQLIKLKNQMFFENLYLITCQIFGFSSKQDILDIYKMYTKVIKIPKLLSRFQLHLWKSHNHNQQVSCLCT